MSDAPVISYADPVSLVPGSDVLLEASEDEVLCITGASLAYTNSSEATHCVVLSQHKPGENESFSESYTIARLALGVSETSPLDIIISHLNSPVFLSLRSMNGEKKKLGRVDVMVARTVSAESGHNVEKSLAATPMATTSKSLVKGDLEISRPISKEQSPDADGRRARKTKKVKRSKK